MLVALDQGFVDIAFVEFRIAHQRDEAAHFRRGDAVARRPKILDEAGKGGNGHPEPHRTGREIHSDPVLGARRIGLRAAKSPEPLQLVEALATEQIFERMQNRPGMGLHCHPVLRAQKAHEQGGHDGDHRRRGRLMPADFQPVARYAHMIGIVDHLAGQPEQQILDPRQSREIHGISANVARNAFAGSSFRRQWVTRRVHVVGHASSPSPVHKVMPGRSCFLSCGLFGLRPVWPATCWACDLLGLRPVGPATYSAGAAFAVFSDAS